MLLARVTLSSAVLISLVSAYYSIVGLAAIFAGAFIPIIVMGAALEYGKLVSAVWLHQNWKERVGIIKSYMTVSVVVLIFITSIGVFGFLSRAHLEATLGSETNVAKIQALEQEKARLEKVIEADLAQRDSIADSLNGLNKYNRFSKSLAARKELEDQMQLLTEGFAIASVRVQKIEDELEPLRLEQEKKGVELGPLKYVAEMIYGDQASENFDSAVRSLILIIVFVFDPLAVCLLIASQVSYAQARAKVQVHNESEQHREPDDPVQDHEAVRPTVQTWREPTAAQEFVEEYKMREDAQPREIRDNAADAIVEELKKKKGPPTDYTKGSKDYLA